jgi:hypothetical protein
MDIKFLKLLLFISQLPFWIIGFLYECVAVGFFLGNNKAAEICDDVYNDKKIYKKEKIK